MSYVCLHLDIVCDDAPSLYEYILLTEEQIQKVVTFIEKNTKEHNYFQLTYGKNLLTFYYGKIFYTIHKEKEIIDVIYHLSSKINGLGPGGYSRIGNEQIYEILTSS